MLSGRYNLIGQTKYFIAPNKSNIDRTTLELFGTEYSKQVAELKGFGKFLIKPATGDVITGLFGVYL